MSEMTQIDEGGPGPLGRRRLLAGAGAGLAALALAGCGGEQAAAQAATSGGSDVPERDDATALTWKQARKRLEEGNTRFVAGKAAHPDQGSARRLELHDSGQKPFVCVLSCADSRVPPELVFDQGLGDLFVVRSAGQVVDRAVLGTLQFGVAEFKTALLVVLGHSKCGAVKATVEVLEKKSAASGTEVDALVAAITPAVTEAHELGAAAGDLLSVAIGNNVERVVDQLSDAKVLGAAVKARKLKILGAVYELDTGEVSFV
jgi:carbonic anhydrase